MRSGRRSRPSDRAAGSEGRGRKRPLRSEGAVLRGGPEAGRVWVAGREGGGRCSHVGADRKSVV